MKNKESCWNVIIYCVCIFAVILTLSITTYYRHQDRIIAKMVSEGANPLDALCSMTDTYGTHPLCMVRATIGNTGSSTTHNTISNSIIK